MLSEEQLPGHVLDDSGVEQELLDIDTHDYTQQFKSGRVQY